MAIVIVLFTGRLKSRLLSNALQVSDSEELSVAFQFPTAQKTTNVAHRWSGTRTLASTASGRGPSRITAPWKPAQRSKTLIPKETLGMFGGQCGTHAHRNMMLFLRWKKHPSRVECFTLLSNSWARRNHFEDLASRSRVSTGA